MPPGWTPRSRRVARLVTVGAGLAGLALVGVPVPAQAGAGGAAVFGSTTTRPWAITRVGSGPRGVASYWLAVSATGRSVAFTAYGDRWSTAPTPRPACTSATASCSAR